jgi:hypothetical protein
MPIRVVLAGPGERHLIAHADLEKAKAKIDWLIWNELRVSADAYRRIRERVKAPGFAYDGSW